MYINNDKVNDIIVKLKNDIEVCEREYYNIYYHYNDLKHYWYGGHSNAYFELIENKRKRADLFFSELDGFFNILNNICEFYKKYGNKVKIRDDIEIDSSKFDNLIESYISIDNLYKRILNDYTASYNARIKIWESREKLITVIQKIKMIWNENKKVYKEIIDNEHNIQYLFSKIKMPFVDYDDFFKLPTLGANSNKKGFKSGIEIKVKNLNSLIIGELTNYNCVVEDIDNFLMFYKSKNCEYISELLNIIKNNFKNIHKFHDSSIIYLNKEIESMAEITKDIIKDLDKIGVDKNVR